MLSVLIAQNRLESMSVDGLRDRSAGLRPDKVQTWSWNSLHKGIGQTIRTDLSLWISEIITDVFGKRFDHLQGKNFKASLDIWVWWE